MVATAKTIDAIKPVAAAHGVSHVDTLEAPDGGSFAELAADMSAEHETVARDADDLAGLLYTSGTTGRSKGAMITHRNLESNACTLHAYWGFVPGDVLLHALPTFHVHGLYVALNTALLNGSKILWLQRFTTDDVLRLLPQATVMMGVPTFYTRLLAEPGFTKDICQNMRLFVAGSAPLLAETHRDFEARTGHRILERYGMSEAGMITSNPYDGDRIAGTVGFALPDIDVRICDDEGHEVATGDVGVLEVRGPNVFKGYWGMPEKTADEMRDDGFFISGDNATMAEDGRIAIVGRAKDLIISGGLNVYPKEIEDRINDIAGVGESAVVGIPHADFGEGVVAVVCGENDQAPPSEAQIIGHLDGQLAKFKMPKRVYAIDALPRNAMGKVQKADLRELYKETFKPA